MQSQVFRLSVPKGGTPIQDVHIDPRFDKRIEKHVILWKDIQQVFANAKYVLNGGKVVSFMVDDDFNDLVPARLLYHPGVVLKVVTTDSENLPAALPSSPRYQSTPSLSQQEIAASTSNTPAITPVKQAKSKSPAPAATTSAPGRSSTSTLPSVTSKNAPSSHSPTSVKDIGRIGADASIKDSHFNSEVAAQEINSGAEKSTLKASQKNVVVASKIQPGWGNDREAEVFLSVYCETVAFRQGGFDQKGRSDFFKGDAMRCTKMLAYAKHENSHLVATAALLLATERGVEAVDQDVLKVVFRLMETNGLAAQVGISTVLIRLASNDANKVLIVKLGGLKSLRNLLPSLRSVNRRELCQDYLTAINELAMKVNNLCNILDYEDSIAQAILQDKATLTAIVSLAQDDDVEILTLALRTLIKLSEAEGFAQAAVSAELLPTIMSLTGYKTDDFGMGYLATLNDMTSNKIGKDHQVQPRPDMCVIIKNLLDSANDQFIHATLLVLAELAQDERYRKELESSGCLTPLLKPLNSSSWLIIHHVIAVLVVLAKTIPQGSELPSIVSKCLERLIELLDPRKSLIFRGDEARLYIVKTFRLLLERDGSREAILDMGLVKLVRAVILKESPEVKQDMLRCLCQLSYRDDLRPRLLQMGILETIIQLAQSTTDTWVLTAELLERLTFEPADMTPFVQNWAAPAAGLRGYLVRSFESDEELQPRFAFRIIVRLVVDPILRRLIAQAGRIRVSLQCMSRSLQAVATDNRSPKESKVFATAELKAVKETIRLLGW